jgi:uncharacterized membrane protein YgdD (TMEM256/DUF423 family)
MIMAKRLLIFASLNGAFAVILGAFGAHGLKGKITASLLAAFQTGTHYHMIHVLALIGLALLLLHLKVISRWLMATAYLWMLGMLIFSGSLYGLSLGGPSWLGPVTPIGGSLLILGWLSLTMGVAKSSFPPSS